MPQEPDDPLDVRAILLVGPGGLGFEIELQPLGLDHPDVAVLRHLGIQMLAFGHFAQSGAHDQRGSVILHQLAGFLDAAEIVVEFFAWRALSRSGRPRLRVVGDVDPLGLDVRLLEHLDRFGHALQRLGNTHRPGRRFQLSDVPDLFRPQHQLQEILLAREQRDEFLRSLADQKSDAQRFRNPRLRSGTVAARRRRRFRTFQLERLAHDLLQSVFLVGREQRGCLLESLVAQLLHFAAGLSHLPTTLFGT